MSKGNRLKYLKRTKARVTHQCHNCKATIASGEYYYKETINDKFLRVLYAKDFCAKCNETFGNNLLAKKSKGKINDGKDKPLNGFV